MRHFAGADLAFASDSSALVIVYGESGGFRVACVEELRPRKGAPLRPKHVIDTFAGVMRVFGVASMYADGHYRESAREHLEPHGIRFQDAPGGMEGKERVYLNAKKLIHEGRVRIPRHPRLLAQLRAVVSKDKPGGGVSISSPRRAGGGHGDIVSALVLALWGASRVKVAPTARVPVPRIGPDRENRPITPGGDGLNRIEGLGGIHIGAPRKRTGWVDAAMARHGLVEAHRPYVRAGWVREDGIAGPPRGTNMSMGLDFNSDILAGLDRRSR